MDKDREKFLAKTALEVRKDVVRTIGVANANHLASSLSVVEILVYLYWEVMRVDPQRPNWEGRDRLVFSKGHACPALYAVLARLGFFDREELWSYRRLGSMLQGHPEYRRTPGIDASSGSLGMGLGIAVGMALSLRLRKSASKVYCLLGDGEFQEGVVWESIMNASHYKLDNLTAIVDVNGCQMEGRIENISNLEPMEEKLEAFGWKVLSCDGHDLKELEKVFTEINMHKGSPTIILARTRPGKGLKKIEEGLLRPTEPVTRLLMEEALRELEAFDKAYFQEGEEQSG